MRDLSNMNILVVENNTHMRKVLVSLLGAFEVGQVMEADGSFGGFSLIATEEIDLVLLDFFLGDHDGLDIVELLRTEKPCPNYNVPIIIVTAAPLHPRVQAAKDLGADAILGKPLFPVELYEAITGVLETRKANPSPKDEDNGEDDAEGETPEAAAPNAATA